MAAKKRGDTKYKKKGTSLKKKSGGSGSLVKALSVINPDSKDKSKKGLYSTLQDCSLINKGIKEYLVQESKKQLYTPDQIAQQNKAIVKKLLPYGSNKSVHSGILSFTIDPRKILTSAAGKGGPNNINALLKNIDNNYISKHIHNKSEKTKSPSKKKPIVKRKAKDKNTTTKVKPKTKKKKAAKDSKKKKTKKRKTKKKKSESK